MEGDNKDDSNSKLCIEESKKVRNATVTIESASQRLNKQERGKIVQEDLDTLILLVQQLQEEHDNVESEDIEYKSRYENQAELNAHYETGIAEMRKLKGKLQHWSGQYSGMDNAELHKLVTDLQRNKTTLESQLKDLEWRLDQEAKAYYKADEKRKALQKDAARKHYKLLDEQLKYIDNDRDKKLRGLERGQPTKDFTPKAPRQTRQVPQGSEDESDPKPNVQKTPDKGGKHFSFSPKKSSRSSTTDSGGHSPAVTDSRSDGGSSPGRRKAVLRGANRRSREDGPPSTGEESPRSPAGNIHMDRRILDPKRGPIKKTAATRQLPKLNKPR